MKPSVYGHGCVQQALGIDTSMGLVKSTIENLKTMFNNLNPDFRIAYKNMDYTKKYKTLITDGNDNAKLLGYKDLVSYPYVKCQFDIGNYIHFNYYNIDNSDVANWSTWLIIALDPMNLYNVNGRMLRCNEILKWKDKNGVIKSYPCHIPDGMKYTTLNLGQRGVTEPDADISITVPHNVDIDTVYINQRFLFRGKAYVCVQKNTEISNKIFTMYLNKVQEQPKDDIKNNIAWNGADVISPLPPIVTTDILLPEIQSILQGKTQSFSIYNYTDAELTSNTFNIEVLDIPSANYTLLITDGNNFSIKNIRQFNNNPLTLKITNNENGSLINKRIWLKGVF